ncbi:hypothetical protein [Ferrimonas marina]|uniref:MSHA biogenesis protein MshJ n=1 Tax=Ferrimonas marina TaxID=299255 RepID=A0A1M5Y114_9GAMM|nr:hypothetical protein [Ferrimonas marina]SHI05488.1 MSHA biogenesis protein MshJ [Ferrimonas marina]
MKWWQKVDGAFTALSQRERVMLMGALLVAVVLASMSFWVEPMQAQHRSLTARLAQAEQDNLALSQEITLVEHKLEQDPNGPLQQELSQLNRRLERQQQALEQELVDLILPEQMAGSLAMLLGRAEGVQLVHLNILPSQQLVPEGGLYRHGVQLELAGSYFDLMGALERMEQLEQRFYWRQLSYRVTDYPEARLQLQLDTLGTEEEPIRVGHDHTTAAAGTAGQRR